MNMLPAPFDKLKKADWKLRTFRKGDIVFRQEDPTFAIFYLQKGTTQLERQTVGGQKVIIHQARKEQTFAEASLFSDRYHCDAVVTSQSEIVIMTKKAILDAMDNDPTFSNLLLARFARQVQSYRHRLEILAINSAIERVYYSLAAGMLRSDVVSLAREINLTHEATYRALAKLCRDGRIIKTGRGSYILNQSEI